MPKQSAGLLMYRYGGGALEVFLVHPGGPFWAKKDDGAWSVPKGEFVEGEDPLQAAKREFQEETGVVAAGDFHPLDVVKQPSGKLIFAWAIEGDLDAAVIRSNTFSMEWPPHSGKIQEFPEIDRGAWFALARARMKIVKGQLPFLERLQKHLGAENSLRAMKKGSSE